MRLQWENEKNAIGKLRERREKLRRPGSNAKKPSARTIWSAWRNCAMA